MLSGDLSFNSIHQQAPPEARHSPDVDNTIQEFVRASWSFLFAVCSDFNQDLSDFVYMENEEKNGTPAHSGSYADTHRGFYNPNHQVTSFSMHVLSPSSLKPSLLPRLLSKDSGSTWVIQILTN
jgi:hypothetical protein